MLSRKSRFKVWFNNTILYRIRLSRYRHEIFIGNFGDPPRPMEYIGLEIPEEERLARLSYPDEKI